MTPLCVLALLLAAMLGASLGVVAFAACVLAGRIDEELGYDE